MRAEDLRPAAQPAPDGTIRIGRGGVVVLNRAIGGEREAYYDFNDEDIVVPIERTGSSGGRSDLVVAQVEDPYAAGTQYQVPADPTRGPYIHIRVISNVAKTVYSPHQLANSIGVRSAVALCRVDLPANTTAITQAMIKDMRAIANGPQRYQEPDPPPDPPPPMLDQAVWTDSRYQGRGGAGSAHTLRYTDRNFINWPSQANWRVPIPKWARGVDILCLITNPQQWDGHIWGDLRVGIGDQWGEPQEFDMDAIPVPQQWPKAVAWLLPGTNITGYQRPNRVPLHYATTLRFGSSFPGTIRDVRVQGRMKNDANTRGRIVADIETVIYMQLAFRVEPIIN